MYWKICKQMRYIKQGPVRNSLGVGLIDLHSQLKEFDFNRLLIRWCSWFVRRVIEHA